MFLNRFEIDLLCLKDERMEIEILERRDGLKKKSEKKPEKIEFS